MTNTSVTPDRLGCAGAGSGSRPAHALANSPSTPRATSSAAMATKPTRSSQSTNQRFMASLNSSDHRILAPASVQRAA